MTRTLKNDLTFTRLRNVPGLFLTPVTRHCRRFTKAAHRSGSESEPVRPETTTTQ